MESRPRGRAKGRLTPGAERPVTAVLLPALHLEHMRHRVLRPNATPIHTFAREIALSVSVFVGASINPARFLEPANTLVDQFAPFHDAATRPFCEGCISRCEGRPHAFRDDRQPTVEDHVRSGSEMLDTTRVEAAEIVLRPARPRDRDALDRLRLLSLKRFLDPSLSASQQGTLRVYTQLDPRLVEDGTYFVLEVGGRIAASGGWSRRAALVRRAGDAAEEERFLDPSCDPAAVRAMYTHPDFARTGLGTILLACAETAARLAGFRRAELIATTAGRGLYLARGWRDVSRIALGPDDCSAIDAFLMQRDL